MRVAFYERIFLSLSALVLVAFLVALFFASFALNIHLPSPAGHVEPGRLAQTPPFDRPGLRQTGPGQYEVVMIGQIWSFLPNEVRVPTGATVTFVATSRDVVHGLHVDRTNVNLMLIPGQVARARTTFRERGEYLFLCHEYCGVGHHLMYGRVIVE